MKPNFFRKWMLMGFLALVLLAPNWVAAQTTFGRIIAFGTSLSDPGNAFAIIKTMSLPPYDTLDPFLVPDAPYGKGGHHFSNGATWIEQFARPLGLEGNVRPAFQSPGTGASNYSVGGARARNIGADTLSAEVAAFQHDFNNAAPPDALYAMEMGSNDVRDALAAFAAGGDANAIISDALNGIDDNIMALYSAGARKFLVWNAPNIEVTPAVRILEEQFPGAGQAAAFLTQSFNAGLDIHLGSLAGLPGIEIVRFDIFGMLNDVIADPEQFGLSVVDKACVTPNIPPFECQMPDTYLFWDGIHPTRVVQALIAEKVAVLLAQ
jgi:phospholipase/lecithinase/hemolysin